MCKEKTLWEKSVEFHGHACPGLSMGYRASMEALDRLNQERSQDEELVAIVETDACGVDAVQVVTGCTFGKGNLIYKDLGKQAFTFGVRGRDKGIRVVLKYGAMNNLAPRGWSDLRQKVFSGEAENYEREQFDELQRQMTQNLLEVPFEEIMEMQQVNLELPEKARIYDTVQCKRCGEGVMEPRTRAEKDGYVCLDCS